MTGRNPGIHYDGLTVRYPAGREPAIAGVTLDVPPGSLVGLSGRSGAGKSTLALAGAGFIPRVVRATVTGSVDVGGIAATPGSAAELAGQVGIVFATPSNQLSSSKLTVREELAFGLENLAVPRAEMDARIDATLHRLEINHLADREPFALSGGEQQKVAIASILVMGSRALILDEPTAQLDPAGTRTVGAIVAGLAREGAAVLCVEHDSTILGSADTVAVLDAGRMVACDRPGAALGSAALAPIGLRPPAIVRLAELGRVGPEAAFDLDRIAGGLAELRGRPVATPSETTPPRDIAFETPRSAPVALRIEGLVHRYPTGLEALRGVDLTIEAGERVAIVGRNGSGKTTLARHLVGLLRPTSGRVFVGDRDAAREAVHSLAGLVGFVFQDPAAQLFERSVEREVAFGPRNVGVAAADLAGLVDRALRAVGLEAERATNPYDLDLSRRKLVALASVLAMDTPVVLLDEPTVGQDGEGVERVGAIVDALAAAGRTVVAISHDMDFAATHFSRIVVMREGEVIADGPPEAVFGPDGRDLLSTTAVEPPLAARLGARIGLGSTPTEAALIRALARAG